MPGNLRCSGSILASVYVWGEWFKKFLAGVEKYSARLEKSYKYFIFSQIMIITRLDQILDDGMQGDFGLWYPVKENYLGKNFEVEVVTPNMSHNVRGKLLLMTYPYQFLLGDVSKENIGESFKDPYYSELNSSGRLNITDDDMYILGDLSCFRAYFLNHAEAIRSISYKGRKIFSNEKIKGKHGPYDSDEVDRLRTENGFPILGSI